MAAMLKDGRHLEFLIGTHTLFKNSKEYLSKSNACITI